MQMLYGKVGAYMTPVAHADEGNKDRYSQLMELVQFVCSIITAVVLASIS